MAKKASCKPTVHLTRRALLDIQGIESYSIEQFGKRVANLYLSKLEAGIQRIAENPELLRGEKPFHTSFKFYRVEKHVFACETGIEGRIIVLTLLHASMDIPECLAELEPNLKVEAALLLKQLRRSSP